MYTKSIILAAVIAYLAGNYTGCLSMPVSESETATESVCHRDFDIQQFLPQCYAAGEAITKRYFYDSASSTCSATYTCSLGFASTHETFEECNEACNENTNRTTTGAYSCLQPPSLNRGNSIKVNCEEAQCSVYYSCDDDYELFPMESRGKRVQCLNGVWDEHTAYCAKISLDVYVNNARSNEVSPIRVKNGDDIMLSCEVNEDIDSELYNITWTFSSHDQETVLIDDTNQIFLASVNNSQEGKYSCSVTGLIIKELEIELKVIEHGLPNIVGFMAKAEGASLTGVCVCEGYPNPKSWWRVNDHIFTNELSSSPDKTFNVLYLSPGPGSYNVSCECENQYGKTTRVTDRILEIAESKKKRSTVADELTGVDLSTFCDDIDQGTANVVTGQILRRTRSTVHLKIEKVLATKNHENNADISENAVIRAVHSDKKLARHRKYTVKLENEDGKLSVVNVLPHVEGMDGIIRSFCQ